MAFLMPTAAAAAFAEAVGGLRNSMNGLPAAAPVGGGWTLRNT